MKIEYVGFLPALFTLGLFIWFGKDDYKNNGFFVYGVILLLMLWTFVCVAGVMYALGKPIDLR